MYEYAAQWYSDGSDSWIPFGWQGDDWGSLDNANATVAYWKDNHPPHTDYRIIRRLMAGPIEILGAV